METTKKSKIKTYSEMSKLPTFEDRFNYLKLDGKVGFDTFGFDRYINQQFYKSSEWKQMRHKIIVRDNGCDLGIPDRPISGKFYIHHMNPINVKDVKDSSEYLLNSDYLVLVSHKTHNAIHYGSKDILTANEIADRKSNDTCPWKKLGGKINGSK